MTQPWTGACLDGICFRATRLAGDSGVERLVVITSAKPCPINSLVVETQPGVKRYCICSGSDEQHPGTSFLDAATLAHRALQSLQNVLEIDEKLSARKCRVLLMGAS